MSLVVDEHRQYLSDTNRIDCFRRGLHEVVRPGDIVVDLGSGTGILGLIALEAGARHVYSIEESSLIEVSRRIAADNKLADRVTFVRGFSRHVDLPEAADVVVADQIGRIGFDAGVFDYFEDARRRFLRPGGTLVPWRLEIHAAPIEDAEQWALVDFWANRPAGYDFGSVRALAANTGYPVNASAAALLGPPGAVAALDTWHSAPFRGSARSVIERCGTLHGILGWFAAELSPTVSMTNSPLDPHAIGRRQAFLPVDPPVAVDPGDAVDIEMRVSPVEVVLSWRVEVLGGDGAVRATRRHSTWNGMVIAKEDLAHTRPDSRPVLDRRGIARRTVLELCDGERTLREIEDEVERRHAGLFETHTAAELFVAEVVTSYAV